MDYTALSRFSYGMYVLTTKDGDKPNAMLLSIASQVASEPAIISISVSKANLSFETIKKTNLFNLSVVTTDAPVDFVGGLGFSSGRDVDKLKDLKHVLAKNGVPAVTENCSAYLECAVMDEKDFGETVVFYAKVTNLVVLGPSKPLTLEHYQKELNGTVSKNSPAYSGRYMLAQ